MLALRVDSAEAVVAVVYFARHDAVGNLDVRDFVVFLVEGRDSGAELTLVAPGEFLAWNWFDLGVLLSGDDISCIDYGIGIDRGFE